MKVILIFEKNKPPFIKISNGITSQKGYFDTRDKKAILNDIAKHVFDINTDSKVKVNWNINKKNILASDKINESIILKIEEQDYYLPFNYGNEIEIFKVRLPNIIAFKKLKEVRFYCTNVKFDEITIESEVYPLQLPHISNSGIVCTGSFKEKLNLDNPEKYFIDLLCYPSSHSWEVQKLRDIDKNGYQFDETKKIQLIHYL